MFYAQIENVHKNRWMETVGVCNVPIAAEDDGNVISCFSSLVSFAHDLMKVNTVDALV